jgi:hypothetical protein
MYRLLKSSKKVEINTDEETFEEKISSNDYRNYITQSNNNDLEGTNINSVHTINTYLHSLEEKAIVYEVFTLFFSSLQEMNKDESVKSKEFVTEFKTGANEERYIKAQNSFTIACENAFFRKEVKSNEDQKFLKILLVAVQNINREEKREVIKMVNSLNFINN